MVATTPVPASRTAAPAPSPIVIPAAVRVFPPTKSEPSSTERPLEVTLVWIVTVPALTVVVPKGPVLFQLPVPAKSSVPEPAV